jgi:hypothetical protein
MVGIKIDFGNITYLIGASAIAVLAGFLAFFAPGGIGVRDSTLLVFLLPLADSGIAATVSILVRLINTTLDISVGIFSLMYSNKLSRISNE